MHPKRAIILTAILAAILLLIIVALKFHEISILKKINHSTGKEKYTLIQRHYPVVYKNLHAGMTKAEVEAIIGKPQNMDSDYVWCWACSDETDKNWSELTSRDFGYYIVFWDNRLLVNLVKNVEGKPEEVLESYAGYSKQEAEKLLWPARSSRDYRSINN